MTNTTLAVNYCSAPVCDGRLTSPCGAQLTGSALFSCPDRGNHCAVKIVYTSSDPYPWRAICTRGWRSLSYAAGHAAQTMADEHMRTGAPTPITNVLSAPVVFCDREVTTEHGTNPCGVRLVSSTAACPNAGNHDGSWDDEHRD